MAVEVAVTAQLHRMARQGPQDLRALIALVQRRVVEEAPDGPLSRRLERSLQPPHLPVQDLGVVGLLVLLEEPAAGAAEGVVPVEGAVVVEKIQGGELFKKNRMLRDTVIENYDMDLSRTAKVYDSLEQACYEFDLEKPMWLDKNKREFIRHARTRFDQDNFIEQIDFDYLDFQVIEEDY